MKPRIVIDRLALDLRGIDPALAQAAVERLVPALQAQLRSLARPGMPATAMRRPAAPHAPVAAAATPGGTHGVSATPDTLAAHLAHQIVRRLPEG